MNTMNPGTPSRDVSALPHAKPKVSRRTVMAGAAWTTPAILSVATVPAWAASPAQLIAGGRLLSGQVLGNSLDSLASVNGIKVANVGSGATSEPWGVAPLTSRNLGADAFMSALDVSAVNGLAAISAAVKLDLSTPLGTVNQYGLAGQGVMHGASGAVDDSGAVQTNLGAGSPAMAVVDLAHLIRTVGRIDIGTIGNVRLIIGALWGQALWNVGAGSAPVRTYLMSYVRTEATSPALGALVSSAAGVVGAVETAVNRVITTVTTLTLPGLNTILNGLLSTLQLGTVSVGLTSVSIDLAAARTALSRPVSSANNLVTIAPADGVVTLDLGATLKGLNGLAPNTELLINAPAVTSITESVTSAVSAVWYRGLRTLVDQARAGVTVTGTVTVRLSAVVLLVRVPVLDVVISFSDVSLASLLDGTARVTTRTDVLGIPGLLGPLLNRIVAAVVAAVLPSLGGAIENELDIDWTATDRLVAAVTTELGDLYRALQGSDVLSLIVNYQADSGGVTDPWTPQHQVAALNLGVLKGVGGGLNLFLGRAGVGPTTP